MRSKGFIPINLKWRVSCRYMNSSIRTMLQHIKISVPIPILFASGKHEQKSDLL